MGRPRWDPLCPVPCPLRPANALTHGPSTSWERGSAQRGIQAGAPSPLPVTEMTGLWGTVTVMGDMPSDGPSLGGGSHSGTYEPKSIIHVQLKGQLSVGVPGTSEQVGEERSPRWPRWEMQTKMPSEISWWGKNGLWARQLPSSFPKSCGCW